MRSPNALGTYLLRHVLFLHFPIQISNGERFSEFGVSYVPPIPQFQLLEFKLRRDVTQQMVDMM